MSSEQEKAVTGTVSIPAAIQKESRKDFVNEVLKMPGGEKILECIQCGSCAGGCPTRFAMDYSPMQIIKMINLGMKKEVLSSSTIWVCSTCYTCAARCPRDISFATLMMTLKNKAIEEHSVKNPASLKFHKYFFEVVNKYGILHDPSLFLKLINVTDLGSVRNNVGLGLRLLKKGKMKIRAQKIEQISVLETLLEKTDERRTH